MVEAPKMMGKQCLPRTAVMAEPTAEQTAEQTATRTLRLISTAPLTAAQMM